MSYIWPSQQSSFAHTSISRLALYIRTYFCTNRVSFNTTNINLVVLTPFFSFSLELWKWVNKHICCCRCLRWSHMKGKLVLVFKIHAFVWCKTMWNESESRKCCCQYYLVPFIFELVLFPRNIRLTCHYIVPKKAYVLVNMSNK